MGYGGALIWTGLARNLKAKFPNKKIIFIYEYSVKQYIKGNKHPDHIIYRNNPDISLIIPKKIWKYVHLVFPKYYFIPINMEDSRLHYWEEVVENKMIYKKGKHAISILCDNFAISKVILKPQLLLTKKEQKKVAQLFEINKLKKNSFICIEPHFKTEFTPNKAWFWERWQQLVTNLEEYLKSLKSDIKLVQVGKKTNKMLTNTINLTGQTSFREMSGILENALFFIGYEGGLAHLASIFDRQNIILISAILPKELMAYPHNINFYSEIECMNCGLLTPCPIDRECMKRITVEDVFKATQNLINKYNDNK